MTARIEHKSLRKVVIAGVAALSFIGVAQSIEPAQAFPVTSPMATAGVATQGVELAAYRRYYHRHFFRRRPVPCRGGLKTHISKRYC